MHSPSLKSAVRRIRSLAVPPDGQADRDLLARFRATRDDRAFAALVARHGPAVLGTCRRVLADPHAAEDAFQATFLVLARRPGAVRKPAALGCWLHGVAVRVSMKLRGRLARQPRSLPAVEVPADPADDVLWRDVRRVLDEEVNRLPDRLRLPVFLCYFEGKTRDEAADALGWKVTTLRGRLEDGRQRLRTRLALRGVELSAALLAVSAAADGLAVGDALLESTVRAAAGAASKSVQSLASGIATTGTAAKATLTAGAVLLALGLGVGLLGYRAGAGETPGGPGPTPKAPQPEKPKLAGELLGLMQAADRVWVVDEPTDKVPVPEPAEVLKGMSPPDRGYSFRFKAEALKDLPRKGHRWIVFLKSIDEVDFIPKVEPVAGAKWYVPADDATVAALREYVPPCRWGETSNGLRLGLYARPGAEEPTVEVVLQNVGTKDLTVEQLRGNVFDDWPNLTFAVTNPARKTYRVERHDGAHKDGDAPTERVLKAGERYIHVVRPGRWLTAPDGGHRGGSAGNAPAGLFAGGGDFKVEATYQLTDGRDPPRWWIGKLTSKPVTVSVPVPGAYGEPAGDFRLRLRPAGKLKPGDSPELVLDAKYAGKQKWTIDRRPENAEVEWDGKWYTPPARPSRGGLARTELAPGSEFLPWDTVRPDGEWVHVRDKPGAAGDPGEATKELVPFRLTPGSHTVRVAYWFGKEQRAVSNAITVEVAPDGWGDPAGGVKARLRIGNTKLKPGDPLAFELDLRNVGLKAWKLDADPFAGTVLVDGVPYTYMGPIDRKGNFKELKPGGELAPFVTMTVDPLWRAGPPPPGRNDEAGRLPPGGAPFRLSPGKHTISVAFPLDGDKVRAVSNTVEVTVEAPPLDPATRAMALGADRIWVVPSPTRAKPVPTPVEVLKGPPADVTGGGLFDLRLLPADDPKAKWIVFLLAAEDEKSVPEVKVWQWSQWFRPYTPETAAGIRQVIQPAEWGPERDGLRMGLRMRPADPAAGHPVVAEVTIRNVGAAAKAIDQHRYNIYDYWPRTRFEVTTPGGMKWLLEKPDGEIGEADAPTRITLKPGEVYVQAIRLDRWPSYRATSKERRFPTNVFDHPGEYTVTARYAPSHPAANDKTWPAALESAGTRVIVKPANAKTADWSEAVGGVSARLRMPKTKFTAGENLAFELDLKCAGTTAYDLSPVPPECVLHLDGVAYTCADAIRWISSPVRLTAGGELVPFLKFDLAGNWTVPTRTGDKGPLPLTPGKHRLQVAYPVADKLKPISNEVEFEVAAADWGEPAGGIRARVRLGKLQFKAGDPLAFEFDLKNTGDQTYEDGPVPMHCRIELDGAEYRYTAPLSYRTATKKLAPGKEFVPYVKVTTDPWWTHVGDDGPGGPLTLTPGRHKLRVSYPLLGGLQPTSPVVEFVVTGNEWGEPANDVRARLRLAKAKLKAAEPLTFDLDLRNDSEDTRKIDWAYFHCDLTLDGTRYVYAGPVTHPLVRKDLKAKGELAPFLTVTPDANWVTMTDPRVPFKLATGKHTLSVSYPVGGKAPAATPAVEFEVTSEDWGEAVGGVAARLRMPRTKFAAGDKLAFELDLKCAGDKAYDPTPIPPECELHLDGVAYQHADPVSWPGSKVPLKPGDELVPFLKFDMGGNWGVVTDGKRGEGHPLPLAPGKHRLRVAFPVTDRVKPLTKEVEFEVVADPADPPGLPALVAAADRIVVATIDWTDPQRPGLKPTRTLKGPNNRWQPDVQRFTMRAGDEPIPGKSPGGPWILFLKAEEDGVEVPRLSPAVPRGWLRRATEKEIAAVLAALPRPAGAGAAKGGLALALRMPAATARVADGVRLEVVLTADGKGPVRVLQQRYNVYDYWPFLSFEVTGPDGKTITLKKIDGPFDREDFIDEFAVKPGEDYVHVVRLNHWPAVLRGRTEGKANAGVPFRAPGRYTVTAKYAAPVGFQNIRPGVQIRDWPYWAGELTSNPVAIEVTAGAGGKGPFDEVRVVTDAGPMPLLYLVLTRPKADHTALEGLVTQHAGDALAEADRRTFQAGNIVFLVRDKPGDARGYVTGFSREQLEEIKNAAPADARRLVGRHAWSTGALPAEK